MVKIIVLVVCALVLYGLLRNKILPKKKEEKKELDTTNMEKDPICGTYVPEDTPYRVKYYEEIYFFCSEECMEKFKAKKTDK